MIAFRGRMAAETGAELLVWVNPEGRREERQPFDYGTQRLHPHHEDRGAQQALDHYGFDAPSAARAATQEASRAKERSSPSATASTSGIRATSGPELWRLYNTARPQGESIRVFRSRTGPSSTFWLLHPARGDPVVPLYFAAERPIVERDGAPLILVDDDRLPLAPGETPRMRKVRFPHARLLPVDRRRRVRRRFGRRRSSRRCWSPRSSERQGRVIDYDEAGSMEEKKREGYF